MPVNLVISFEPGHLAFGVVDDCDKILADNQKSVEDFKSGKENALKFLMGRVMKETSGKANPQAVLEMLKKKLT